MDVSLVATEESNATRLVRSAIVVAKGIDSASFHHRSSHQRENTGLPAVRQSPVPTICRQKTTTGIRRRQGQLRATLNRILMLQTLRHVHLPGKRARTRKTEHPSNHGSSHQIRVRVRSKRRTLRHPRTSGSPFRRLLHLHPLFEVAKYSLLQP
jgi:hypothetical protein